MVLECVAGEGGEETVPCGPLVAPCIGVYTLVGPGCGCGVNAALRHRRGSGDSSVVLGFCGRLSTTFVELKSVGADLFSRGGVALGVCGGDCSTARLNPLVSADGAASTSDCC